MHRICSIRIDHLVHVVVLDALQGDPVVGARRVLLLLLLETSQG